MPKGVERLADERTVRHLVPRRQKMPKWQPTSMYSITNLVHKLRGNMGQKLPLWAVLDASRVCVV